MSPPAPQFRDGILRGSKTSLFRPQNEDKTGYRGKMSRKTPQFRDKILRGSKTSLFRPQNEDKRGYRGKMSQKPPQFRDKILRGSKTSLFRPQNEDKPGYRGKIPPPATKKPPETPGARYLESDDVFNEYLHAYDNKDNSTPHFGFLSNFVTEFAAAM